LLHPEALINLNNLQQNYLAIKKKVGDAKVMAVIKADAYGHGAQAIAKSLSSQGVYGFCVALVEEVKELIASGIKEPILHLGAISEDALDIYKTGQVRCTVSSLKELEILQNSKIKFINVHIKVDTGMGRLGFHYQNIESVLDYCNQLDNINLVGLYSHFATADSSDDQYLKLQLNKFKKIVELTKKNKLGIKFFHIANSAAILKHKDTHFNMVRPGITLYGISPLGVPELVLKPVLTLKSKVALVKEFNENSSVGYGRMYKVKSKELIAVLQIGYADGIPTSYANVGEVEVYGQLHPVVGKVSMDLITIKCLNQKLKKGDSVILWGGNTMSLRLENIAKKINVIPYELITGISKRVMRRYVGV